MDGAWKRLALTAALELVVVGCRAERPDDGAPAVLSLARPAALQERYRAWSQARAVAPFELTIALHFARGLTTAPPGASGVVTLDRAAGRLTLRAGGLAGERAVEVLLVDNAPGSSTLPGPEDRLLRAGTLAVEDGRVEGTLRWDPVATDLETDRIALVRPGAPPGDAPLLFGGPSTFERLQRRGEDAPRALASLVRQGAELFERETFAGNGRTCTTCHPAANDLTLDPSFIAMLPDTDALFVFERQPELAGLEHPVLLRQRALVLENVDGFERPGVPRGIPHTLALTTSIRGPDVPFDNTLNAELGIFPPAERTGWSGDGAPGSGSLRDFALGAVVQHFPRSLERVPGRDFRVPTDEELDALEAFQLALGRDADPDLPALRFRSPVVALGQELFLRTDTEGGTQPAAKCVLCHSNGGANLEPAFFSAVLGFEVSGNANFGTGVNDLEFLPGELIDPELPRDGGFGRVPHDGTLCTPARGGFGTVTPEGGPLPPNLCEEDFNTPPLIEAADTGPFFHSNAFDTLEGAVEFYDDEAFNGSAGGQLLASLDSGGIGIELGATQVAAVAQLLRTLGVLENLRQVDDLLDLAALGPAGAARRLLRQAVHELDDGRRVLRAGHLHPPAQRALDEAIGHARDALETRRPQDRTRIERVRERVVAARAEIVE